jgi:uncharacterized membrane protein YebE (DUF533 family)
MLDAKNLLESLVRSTGPSSASADRQAALNDLLAKWTQGGGSSPGSAPPGSFADALRNLTQSSGGVADVLGQVLGQATGGVREGAQRLDEMTGASGRVREAVGQASGGMAPEELIAKLKELVSKHQLETGAVLGSLGGLVLGTQTGRSLAASAAKLGALALISGLAYKAYQNHQQGKPLITGASGLVTGPAPAGSGFEPRATDNDTALLCLRAMIGGAAADGRIDKVEQQKIVGSLQRAGLDEETSQFLRNELEHPATADDLAAAVRSKPQAIQVFTAARLAVELDTADEQSYLVTLADRLGIGRDLAAQVDAAAASTAA